MRIKDLVEKLQGQDDVLVAIDLSEVNVPDDIFWNRNKDLLKGLDQLQNQFHKGVGMRR